MTVIAEGIESFEELAYLQAATKIRYAQGYYFSRPIFLEELRPATPRRQRDARQPGKPPGAGKPRQAYARGERYRALRRLIVVNRRRRVKRPSPCADRIVHRNHDAQFAANID